MGYVKIYYADTALLKNDEVFARFYREVGDDRRAKIDRMARRADKERSLAAGIVLMNALNTEGGSEAIHWEICEDEYGKPYIPGRNDLFFNLSHSGDYVMCAVSDLPIGCDVQEIENKDCRMIANRFFHPNEARAIGDDSLLFTRVWALKESFVKATGRGMSTELSSFTVIGDDGEVLDRVRLCEPKDNEFYLNEYKAEDGYCFASCSAGCKVKTKMCKINYI